MPIQSTRYKNPFEVSIEKIGGLVTTLPAHTIPNEALSWCVNFFKDSTGRLSTRWGTTLLKDTGLGKIDNIGVLYSNNTYYVLLAVGEKIYKYDDLSLLGSLDVTNNIPTFTQFKNKLFIFNGGTVYSYDGSVFKAESSIPKANIGMTHKSRLWLGDCTDYPDYLYYSGVNDETDWSTNGGYYIINPGDGDKIVALDKLNDDIIVFKGNNRRSIWKVVLGLTPDNTEIKGLVYGVTAVNKFATAQALNDMAFFTQDDGLQILRRVEQYGLTKALSVSLPVQNILTMVNPRMLNFTPFNSVFIYSGNEIYLINYLTNDWFKWTMMFNPSCFVNINNELWVADADGKIYKFSEDVFNDNGQAFDKMINTKAFSFGSVTMEKYIRNAEVFLELIGGEGNIYLDIEKDLNTTFNIGNQAISVSNAFEWDNPDIGWDDVNYGWDGIRVISKIFTINLTCMYLMLKFNFIGDYRVRLLGYILRGSQAQKEKE